MTHTVWSSAFIAKDERKRYEAYLYDHTSIERQTVLAYPDGREVTLLVLATSSDASGEYARYLAQYQADRLASGMLPMTLHNDVPASAVDYLTDSVLANDLRHTLYSAPRRVGEKVTKEDAQKALGVVPLLVHVDRAPIPVCISCDDEVEVTRSGAWQHCDGSSECTGIDDNGGVVSDDGGDAQYIGPFWTNREAERVCARIVTSTTQNVKVRVVYLHAHTDEVVAHWL